MSLSTFYFALPKSIRTLFFLKIQNKQELQQIAFNHSSDIDFQEFINLYKTCTAKPYYFLIVNTTLASDNSSLFRKNVLEGI